MHRVGDATPVKSHAGRTNQHEQLESEMFDGERDCSHEYLRNSPSLKLRCQSEYGRSLRAGLSPSTNHTFRPRKYWSNSWLPSFPMSLAQTTLAASISASLYTHSRTGSWSGR